MEFYSSTKISFLSRDDNWLNSNNPYDLQDEEEREREYHLAEIENLDGEDEIEYYLSTNRIEDPRE